MENHLVTILRIKNPPLGNYVKNKFENEGIECFFTNEGLKLGSHYDPNEVLLKVKSYQSEKAVKILLQIHSDYDLNKTQEFNSTKDLRKLLVPINLSESSFPLIRYALALAKKIKAEVKLLYTYEDPSIAENIRHTTSWEKHVKIELQQAHQKAQNELVEFSINFKKNTPAEIREGVKFHYRMLKGTPEHVIPDACDRYQPDLVVMGIGKTKDDSIEFMEKTVMKVVEHSNFPVMAVPCSVEYHEKEKLNVMYATNFYDTDNTSLNKLLSILQPFDKQIHCIHIYSHDEPNHQEKVEQLNKMLEKEYSDYNIQCQLFESSDVVKGFSDFVEKNNIDLISLSKQKRSTFYKMFHTNILGKLLTNEKVPMLIFPYEV